MTSLIDTPHWYSRYCFHRRFEKRCVKGRLNTLSFALSWDLWCCLCCTMKCFCYNLYGLRFLCKIAITYLMQVSNWHRFRFNPCISDSFRSIMNECEICFRRTDSFVVKVRMTLFDCDSFFFSPNRFLKFIPNDSAQIRIKLSFRLNPFNSANSFRMIPCHSPFSPNGCVPLRAQSEWLHRAFKRTGFRMIRKQISHSLGITFIPNESETCIRMGGKLNSRCFIRDGVTSIIFSEVTDKKNKNKNKNKNKI